MLAYICTQITTTKKLNKMEALIRVIGQLEDKRENGNITMTEETLLIRLIEQAEYQLTLKK
jgi:hypothetical protein